MVTAPAEGDSLNWYKPCGTIDLVGRGVIIRRTFSVFDIDIDVGVG